MSNLTILRSYAQKANPASLPPSILLTYSATSLTIFDAYPKSIFHFLTMPRIVPPLTVFDLANLRSLLKRDKELVKDVLLGLNNDAKGVKYMIEEEMVKRYGFKWDVWIGFHGAPSMEHLHLHILSTDLCAPGMKIKKHYNSFHPKLGFFIHIEEVLSWLDAEPSYFSALSELRKSRYEPLLKEDLSCWRCGRGMKNMPTLKIHLQDEWEKLKREKSKSEKKRKLEDKDGDHDQIVEKRNKTTVDSES